MRRKSPFPGMDPWLEDSDADVLLELQPLLVAAYTNGVYADDIDYSKSPLLPLLKIVAGWTENWLKENRVINT